MTIVDRPRVDLREVLRTTCAASPVEAIDVMADGVATLTGAQQPPARRGPRRPGADGQRRARGARPRRAVRDGSAGAGGPAHRHDDVYELAETVLHATGGELHDDATVLCLDWRGGADEADRPDREE